MSGEKTIPVIIGIFTAVVLIGGFLLVSKNSNPAVEVNDEAKAAVSERYFDWGRIDINGGLKEHDFRIKNEGTADLEIANFKTSCMCTEAVVYIRDLKSPSFGMHSNSPWRGKIAPGEEAIIKVIYDPMRHGPQAVGPIIRLVSFNTNDPNNKTIELRLNGNVFSAE